MLDVYQTFSQDLQDYSELFLLDKDIDFQMAISSIPEMSPEDMEKIKKNIK